MTSTIIQRAERIEVYIATADDGEGRVDDREEVLAGKDIVVVPAIFEKVSEVVEAVGARVLAKDVPAIGTDGVGSKKRRALVDSIVCSAPSFNLGMSSSAPSTNAKTIQEPIVMLTVTYTLESDGQVVDNMTGSQFDEVVLDAAENLKKACSAPSFEHINVLFYYLRKQGKYEHCAVNFTTMDMVFHGCMDVLYKKFRSVNPRKKNFDVSMINAYNIVDDFIINYDITYERPWSEEYNVLLPHSLSILASYECRKDIELGQGAYTVDARAPIEVKCNCGVFVASYAEYFISGREMPVEEFNVQNQHLRYSHLLYNHARLKLANGVIDENIGKTKRH
ncbi:hypothetical protein PHJA_000617000 [Phtheirospermum japonicum]|uniref:Uncharacterized protein n=1 Tax=Phtheirospermum japonicum TaxID=374723 RepID=A0A830BRV4_9LAMI|nr:hypothetical protein PHJA_000617000 [Phtheirospermum japonicum]